MPNLRPIYARKLFDIRGSDLLRAGRYSVCLSNPHSELEAIERLQLLWAPGQTLVALSVRSAFDLWLQASAFAEGSEIIISAVTIPHMVSIIELHGLIAVPVDLQASDSSVLAEDVEALITPRTRAVLVAHLFGHVHSLASIAEVTRKHGIPLVEDCAQAFRGLDFKGSPEAELSMFSFGPIKTCTSLGGALVTVRRPDILARIKAIQSRYPLQKQSEFLKKTVKYGAFKFITDGQYSYGFLISLLRRGGQDHHAAITKASHSLAANADLLQQIRFRPSVALVRLLRYRITSFDPASLSQRRARIMGIAERLPPHLRPIGYSQTLKEDTWACHYWICPIRVQTPALVLNELLEAGFDAAAGNASLAVVPGHVTGSGGTVSSVATATDMMARVIYLPVDHAFSEKAVAKLVQVVAKEAWDKC